MTQLEAKYFFPDMIISDVKGNKKTNYEKLKLNFSILHANKGVYSFQIKFYDESSIKQFTYDIPQPYSDGVDPTGDLNAEEYKKFQKIVTDELNKCISGECAHYNISEDHAIIATDFESLEVHFNDSTLTLIYHFIGPQ